MQNKTISRRNFIEALFLAGLATKLSGCQGNSLEGKLLTMKDVGVLMEKDGKLYPRIGNVSYVEFNQNVYLIHEEKAHDDHRLVPFVEEVYAEQGIPYTAISPSMMNDIGKIIEMLPHINFNLFENGGIIPINLDAKKEPRITKDITYNVPIIIGFKSLEQVKEDYAKKSVPNKFQHSA